MGNMSQNTPNEIVAISLALYLTKKDSIHDYESNILTIKRVSSVWNSPVYNVLDKIKLQ
jgi:hypothetical protein